MGTKRVGWARIKSLINENGNELKTLYQQTVNCTVATTLTKAQSGALVYWTHSGAGHDITLPLAEVGMSFKFVIAAGHTAEHDIVCNTSDEFIGKVSVLSTTANVTDTQLGNKTDNFKKINLHATTTTLGGDIGDIIELNCFEANHWHVTALLTLRTGIPAGTAVLTT